MTFGQWAPGVPRPDWVAYTPRLVVNDATVDAAGNITGPSSGTNPTMGTGGGTEGEYFDLGKLCVVKTGAWFGPNSVSVHLTTASATAANPCVFTQAGHGLSNGMAVIPSAMGALLLSAPPLNQDGSYYVVGVSGDNWSLAQKSGGAAIAATGTPPGSVIHIDAVAMNAGSGPYRMSYPGEAITRDRELVRVTGECQLYDYTVGTADFGVDPAQYLLANFHTSLALIDNSTAGLVLASTLPLTSLQGGYSHTNGAVARSINIGAATAAQAAAFAAAIADDLLALLAMNSSVEVSHASPWPWGPNYRLEGLQFLHAA